MNNSTSGYVAIVDDDESLRRSLLRLLGAAGIRSVTYPSAEAFLADTKQRFDCLLLDIQLGGISGLELAQWLASAGGTTPVIFLTAYDEPEMRERALRTGCSAYLRKTESSHKVITAIRAALHQGDPLAGDRGSTGSPRPNPLRAAP